VLEQLLSAQVFGLFLVFARLGSAFSLLPGFGETYVAMRFRLLLAGATSLVVGVAVGAELPTLPASPIQLFTLLGSEITIGLFLGMMTRIMLAALHTGGALIAMQSGLSSAFSFDPAAAQPGAFAGAWLATIAMLLIFVTDTHHVMLRALVDSYEVFRPGAALPIGDFAEATTRVVAESFLLAVKISAPFIVMGLVGFVALGFLQRLMPQVQIFFVATPLQIAFGLLGLALTTAAVMAVFLDGFESVLGLFIIRR
jgi:flagellar biosynthetic protein FliR